MSTARFGRKWADVDEDDEEEKDQSPKSRGARFETPVDEHGIKTVIEYTERDGKTYKVTRRMKQTTVTNWTNRNIKDRKTMAKFGKSASAEAAMEKHLIVRSEDEVYIELTKKLTAVAATKDDSEDKFYEESLAMAEGLTSKTKILSWTEMNRDKQIERDTAAVKKEGEGEKPAEGGAGPNATTAPDAGTEGGKGRYVPPSLRNGKGGDGKGGKDLQQQQDCSLRVTNLSEDCRDGDLQDLFGQFGRLQRVYLAKDQVTFQSRGFAFVTYYNKQDAERAIAKLNGHGYDNLILNVMFAKPKQ